MLDGKALRAAVEKHKPDVIVPEIEAIDTATLAALETRRLARRALGQGCAADHEPRRHPRLRREASSGSSPRTTALPKAATKRLPRRPRSACRASSSRSCRARARARARRRSAEEVGAAWDYAVANMRGDRPRVIVEEFIDFDSEITLLTVATKDGVLFCPPVGPSPGGRRLSRKLAAGGASRARRCSRRATRPRKVVEALGGHGIFGVEFFVRGDQAIFSELSPRPHDTGMVTLISQFPNEFELHLRAILGLPIPSIELAGPSASAVILAERGKRQLRVRRRRRRACARRAGQPGRPQDFRQAQDAQEPPHGRGARARRQRRRCGRTRQGCSRSRPHSLFGAEGEAMRRFASIAVAAPSLLAACNDSRPQQNQPTIKVAVDRAGAAAPARRLQPRDRAQARDLRRRLHLQAGDRRRLRRRPGRTSTCGWPIACMTRARRATGRSSPGPTAAPRSATARTSPAAGFPTARSRSGRRAASTKLK